MQFARLEQPVKRNTDQFVLQHITILVQRHILISFANIRKLLAVAMSVIISIILRLLFVAAIAFIAYWLGIVVAMGFDAGVNQAGLMALGVYLLIYRVEIYRIRGL